MSKQFDGRGLKCPLGFVKAKQHLLLGTIKDYLFDDEMTLYNFTRYLEKQNITFKSTKMGEVTLVELVS